MTPKQIKLLQSSFEAVKPQADDLVTDFYAILFQTAPDVRRMFPQDISAQKQKLIAVLATAVAGLTKLDTLVPVLRDLGAKHAGYGVQEHHYPVVGNALLAALSKAAGVNWSAEIEEAWGTLYGVVSTTMLQGAVSEYKAAV